MQALVLTAPGKVEIQDIPIPKLGPNQALVKIKCAALNRRDQWIREGKYPDIKIGAVLGSDGSGIVEKVADEINEPWIGQEVVINPNIEWGDDPEVQSRKYHVLGMPSNGTLCEYLAVNVDRLHHKPSHLNFAQAACLPMGGLTSYRALFRKGHLKERQNVLISGFGGGVAQLAFLFAIATDAHVYVSTGSDEKVNKALSLGAKGGYNYKKESTYKDIWKTKGGFDLVVDSAGGDQLNAYIKIMRPAGRIVFYGATNGLPSNIDLYRMFWNQLTLQGSTMGNDTEFNEMLNFVSSKKIEPIVDSVNAFADVIGCFDGITDKSRIGKLVVNIS